MRKTKVKAGLIAAVSIILAIVLACVVYIEIYYRADESAKAVLASENAGNGCSVTVDKGGNLIISPEEPIAGLVFYPGAKVEHEAYAPLMLALAERGIASVAVKMPLRFALLDKNAADKVIGTYGKEGMDWYVGGHSLGGVMAAMYAKEHTDKVKGLLLLGSYATVDLRDTGLRVVSVYGTEDKILNMKKYRQSRENLPQNSEEYVIEGGCHSYFGNYGAQRGDGTSTVSAEEQIAITADIFARAITEQKA